MMLLSRKVLVTIRGLNIDSLAKRLAFKLNLFDLNRIGDKELSFVIDRKSLQKFLQMVNDACYNITIKEIASLPKFFLDGYKYIGMIVGIVASCIVCFFMTTFVSGINIRLSNPNGALESEIATYLKANGISYGMKLSEIETKRVEQMLFSEFSDITFVSVKKAGTKIIVNANNSVYSSLGYGPLVSGYNAVIENVFVQVGTAKVKPGDIVKIGDVLIDPDQTGKSQGKVVAKLHLSGSAYFCPKAITIERTGNIIKNETISLFGICFKNQNKAVPFDSYEKQVTTSYVSQNNFLPIKRTTTCYYETMKTEKTLSLEDELESMKLQAKQQAQSKVKNATITTERYYVTQLPDQYRIDCFIETSLNIATR